MHVTGGTSSNGRIAVEDWDVRLPLSAFQKEVILEWQEASAQQPVPDELPEDDDEDETELSKHRRSSAGSVLVPSLELPEAIETTQQFFNWFEAIEEEMEQGQEAAYREYLSTICAYREACDGILSQAHQITDNLSGLEAHYNTVEGKTRTLQTACEKLMEDQSNLATLATQLADRLSYFNELEPISKLFSSPGDQVCLDDRFLPMLMRLDECLAFIQSHMQYRDAELYLMRFRHCMTRGLTLVKMHFVNSMRTTQNDVREKIANRGTTDALTPNLQMSLFYVKFRALAPSLRFLLAQLEARCETHPEYYALFGDCLAAYFNTRQTLLNPYILAHIQGLVENQDVLGMARSGCAYILRICADEIALFHQYFHLGEDELLDYLDSLSVHLYDTLRPLILRESRIDILSELCQTLRIYVSDPSVNAEASMETDGKLRAIEPVVHQILEDAQQRLVFRGQSYIREEIEGFTPREEELSILVRGRGLPGPVAIRGEWDARPVLGGSSIEVDEAADLVDPAVGASSDATTESYEVPPLLSEPSAITINTLIFGGGEWYPTVPRTLYLLNKLSHALPSPIFADLAQDSVSLCISSLHAAASIISSKQTTVDAQLFLIKNLLMLREQVSGFGDLEVRRREEALDFTALREAVAGLLNRNITGEAVKSLIRAGGPVVIETRGDVKQAVDQELKRICENYVLQAAKLCVEPITGLVAKVKDSRVSSSSHPLPSSAAVDEAYAQFLKAIQQHLGATAQKLADYLGDKKTESVLLRVIKTNILDTYETFLQTVKENYSKEVWSSVADRDGISTELDIDRRHRSEG
ncbi:Golgi transport complex subunit 3 [Gaertneriomyces sp. JEL0708]|nr:Golgi transport complex subunit 3 [Gaertneriomyces sp. JEL0708]